MSTRPRSCSTSIPARRPTILDCCRVALDLRDIARRSSACSRVVKTSGGKGLHLSVPLNGATRDRRRHEEVRARARPAARGARPEARAPSTWRRPKRTGQRVRRLEPERPAQDDGVRVLAAHRGAADRVDARRVGRGRRRARRRRRAARCRSRRPTCSTASTTVGDLYADVAHRAPGAARALGSAAWSSTGRSRSSPARAAASARRPRCCSPSAGARSCARRARPTPRRCRSRARSTTPCAASPTRAATRSRCRRTSPSDDEVERMVAATVEHFGRVDILVNNAAITFPGDLDLDDEALRPRDAGRPARAAARDPAR